MKGLLRADIEHALDRIEAGEFIPLERRSKKHCLKARRKHFPSKHVVRLAYEIKYRKDGVGKFRGGPGIVSFLRSLNYAVEADVCGQLPGCQEWCTGRTVADMLTRR